MSGKGIHIFPCPNFRLQDDLEVLTAGAFSFLSLKPRICETSVQRASRRRSGASPGCVCLHAAPFPAARKEIRSDFNMLLLERCEYSDRSRSLFKKAKTPAEQDERALPFGRSPFTPTWVSDSSRKKNDSVFTVCQRQLSS